MTTQVAILAAGMGTRLGRPFPKPLTPLRDGTTIMDQQVAKIRAAFEDVQLYTVVGFKLDMILEAHPRSLFVYNEEFDRTNTSKSLLRALRASGDGGVLWLNGDVVFDPAILDRLKPYLAQERSLVAVNTAAVAEEEVKYTVDADGFIDELSKQVADALGEAVGINYVAAPDKAALIARLDEVGEQDYFERGIELAIQQDGIKFVPVDISDLWAVEVDFAEDLARANEYV
ncbi:NTP transferase domain-containing protein [Cellulomonas sp. PhB150]|uniref:phosphocholine cytidylyltransferase family protein n=1 Tax=Cellulomonas sp. PhB150 TaxID=2485188 RepID=UPI000F4921E0|nr:phosphocholine cytidylyltransferase family protein [Cellulomonas sp. PhB150]ROS31222.1 choline kinase [Cellulomonas sp. PhB150]